MAYLEKKERKKKGIRMLVVTAGLYNEQALEGPRCLKSELIAKGKSGQKELPKALSVVYSLRSSMTKGGNGKTGFSRTSAVLSYMS